MHCHLKPPIPPVVLGFNHAARSDPNFNTIGQCTAELLMIW